MNAPHPQLRIASGLLALALTATPLALRAADTPAAKPAEKGTMNQGGPSAAELKKYDTNHDGKLDEQETAKMMADRAERFKQLLAKYDANHNGKLDDDELAKLKADQDLAEQIAKQQEVADGKKAAQEARQAQREAAKVHRH